ncbi:MAG: hypothetical protein EAZ55_10490 [Cytophagales bacterium]|nr:MAG: hypothetical protein EAZ55_10490 [Cytophagales bacterium]
MKILLLVVFSFFFTLNAHSQDKKQAIEDILNILSTQYGLKIYYTEIPVSTWGNSVTAEVATIEDYEKLLTYLQLFKEEWQKYTPSYIKKTGVKEIVFCKSVAYNGQRRAAIPDCYKEILYYDFLLGNHNPTYQRHVVHHEYYHMIEEQRFGNTYYKDPQWAAFNEPTFQYGAGGASQRGSNQYPMTHPQKGFINLYSTAGLEEDKAEIYAMLFTESERAKVMPWLAEDDILRKKVDYMQKTIDELFK